MTQNIWLGKILGDDLSCGFHQLITGMRSNLRIKNDAFCGLHKNVLSHIQATIMQLR